MKEFILNNWVAIVMTALIFFTALIILIQVRKMQARKKEMKTAAMIDQMSMRRASIDTTYLEREFFQIIERLIYSFYSQQPQIIPGENMTSELYMDWYNRLKREYDLKIKKNIYDFKMVNARVVKQDNSSMYGVSRIEVEAEFKVSYHYSHVTLEQNITKEFRHLFTFLNTNDSWLLEKVSKEDDVKKQIEEIR